MSARALDPATLARLAARAATPEERLGQGFVVEDPALHAAAIERRLARWARHAARGDRERLRETLASRGLDLDRLAPALGAVRLAEGAALPAWVADFAALLAEALPMAGEARPRDPARPLPHEAIVAPFVAAAAARLAPEARASLGEAALRDLERGLLLRLTRLCRPVLDSAFALFDMTEAGRPGAPVAERFPAAMLAAPLPPFLEDRPVLARLLTLACANWREATEELAARLAADRAELAARLLGGRDPGPLAGISVGDADLHDGHREVLILAFADGTRVVYKPRPLGLDAALGGLLAWLAARGLDAGVTVPAVLERPAHGWAAHVAAARAPDAAALRRHARRSGALVALAHALGATDLHAGNLIATGDAPVPIDLETVLSALPRAGSAFAALAAPLQEEARRQRRSLTGSMLLTFWRPLPGGEAYDVSGLWGTMPGERGMNLPLDPPLPPDRLAEMAEPLLEGFEATYRLLLRERAALLAPDGPLAGFAGHPVRVVLRDTATYMRLLMLSVQDEALGDGADRVIALERLNLVAAAETAPQGLLPMIGAERRALEGCDVPRFAVLSDATDLRDAAGVVAPAVMEASPLAEARARLSAFSEGDLAVQRGMLRQSLIARIAASPDGLPREPARPVAAALPPGAGDFAAAARDVAARLRAAAMPGLDGLPVWHGLSLHPVARRYGAGFLGNSLAEGRLGIALFLAALGRALGDATAEAEACTMLAWLTEAADTRLVPAARSHAAPEACGTIALAGALLGRIRPGDDLAPALVRGAVATLAGMPDTIPASAVARAGLLAAAEVFPALVGADLPSRFGDGPPWAPPPRSEGLPALDGYAQGTAGEADALLEAGEPEPAAALMAQAMARGAWRLVPGQPEAELPGLLHGLAGIGHVLLRLAVPGLLPALLPLRAMAEAPR